MSLPTTKVLRSFCDTVLAAGELFPPGNPYRVFREKVLPALWRARPRLARLYCADTGRPAIEPVVTAGTTLLQTMERRPDRLAAEQVRRDPCVLGSALGSVCLGVGS